MLDQAMVCQKATLFPQCGVTIAIAENEQCATTLKKTANPEMQHIIFQAHVSSKSVEIIHWCEYYQFFHNLVFIRCVRNVKKIKETNLSYFFKSEKPAALAHAMGSARFTVGSARFTVGRGAHKHSLMSLKEQALA